MIAKSQVNRLVHGTYFSVPCNPIPWEFMPVPSIPRDSHYDINRENSSFKIIKFMKVTKIKQEIDYDVTAANAHQVKTAPLFHKLETTGKDIVLTLVTHQNVILYKKSYVYLFIYPVSHHKINNRYKYIKKKGE